jgi:hypothetical protein
VIIHFGKSQFGKVDQVPGLFYVATDFFHINYIPLIPMSSYVIVEETGAVVPMPVSVKSVFFAYGRIPLMVGGILSVLCAPFLAHLGLVDGEWFPLVVIVLAGMLFFVGLYASYLFAHASPRRTLRIANHAGLSRARLVSHFAGKLGPLDLSDVDPPAGYFHDRHPSDDAPSADPPK